MFCQHGQRRVSTDFTCFFERSLCCEKWIWKYHWYRVSRKDCKETIQSKPLWTDTAWVVLEGQHVCTRAIFSSYNTTRQTLPTVGPSPHPFLIINTLRDRVIAISRYSCVLSGHPQACEACGEPDSGQLQHAYIVYVETTLARIFNRKPPNCYRTDPDYRKNST